MNHRNPRSPSGLDEPPSADSPIAARRGLGLRLLGWTLLAGSVGLVSCQSLFVL